MLNNLIYLRVDVFWEKLCRMYVSECGNVLNLNYQYSLRYLYDFDHEIQ